MKQLLTTILMHEDYFLILKWQEFSRYIKFRTLCLLKQA